MSSSSSTAPHLPCGVEKGRYPDFVLAYEGYHACVFENAKLPGTQILRIESFRYRDTPQSESIRDIDQEVGTFWEKYWKAKSPTSKRLLIDVIDNGGGDTPIEWYKLLFNKPFQEQYVSFKKIRELSEDPQVLDELFYHEKAKHLWLERIKREGVWNQVQTGGFLPPVPQFCAASDQDCSQGLYQPRDSHFDGEVRILLNQWCVSSCAGFVWELRNLLGKRVKLYGMPDSGDSAYGRVYLDLFIDPKTPEGFRLRVSPRPGETAAKLPPGAILRQSVSVSRTTDATGNVISGVPQKVDRPISPSYHDHVGFSAASDLPWVRRVVGAAVE